MYAIKTQYLAKLTLINNFTEISWTLPSELQTQKHEKKK